MQECGKFLIDIAKLVFGGVILAGIMKYDSVNPVLLFGIGGGDGGLVLYRRCVADSIA